MFDYTRPVKCNVQILNGSKSPTKRFGLVTIKIPKTNIIISLWPSYYMQQNPQNTISKTAIKHYIEFISVRTEYLRWVKMTTYTVIKLRVGTTVK